MNPGNTPMIKVEGILAKLECTNPLGSIKDRIAKYIIDGSEANGTLKPGMVIVEATSGNTGIALSYFATRKGYKIIIVMPENMTQERKQVIRALGADLLLCSPGNFAEAAQIRDKLSELPNFFNPDQFSNPLNVECHYATTGQEILEQTNESSATVDAFVAGVGTGGTVIGVAKAVKEICPDAHIAAVEPAESAVMSGGEPGPHRIPGIGDGFIPAIASDGKGGVNKLIDEVIRIPSADAIEAARYLQQEHHYCVGISSGANFLAAQQLANRYNNVVTVFPDSFANYKSQGLTASQDRLCPYERCKLIIDIGKNPYCEYICGKCD